jgi:hypothetical protein
MRMELVPVIPPNPQDRRQIARAEAAIASATVAVQGPGGIASV